MEIEGSVKLIFETQTFNSGFQKREFVITTKEQYPQDIKFELVKDRIDLVDAYNVGDDLKVHFNIRGNEYNGKYFVNLQAWRIEAVAHKAAEPVDFGNAGLPEEPPMADEGAEDDLPF
jgi:single-strand DNA-binding protein